MTRFKDLIEPMVPAWIIDAEVPVIEAPRQQIGLEMPAYAPDADDAEDAVENHGGTVIVIDI
jgi:hypothetical protein